MIWSIQKTYGWKYKILGSRKAINLGVTTLMSEEKYSVWMSSLNWRGEAAAQDKTNTRFNCYITSKLFLTNFKHFGINTSMKTI